MLSSVGEMGNVPGGALVGIFSVFVDSLLLVKDSLIVAGSVSEVLVSLLTVAAALFLESSLVDKAL